MKFQQQLQEFFEWAHTNSLLSKDAIVPNFEEPPRNKLKAYILQLQDLYNVPDLYTRYTCQEPIRNDNLDTSDVSWVNTLDFTTDEIKSVFGEPLENGTDEDEHTFEWKIEVNGQPLSIYDWGTDTEWHVGCTNKKQFNVLVNYIAEQVQN
jgi:hypothetical protein